MPSLSRRLLGAFGASILSLSLLSAQAPPPPAPARPAALDAATLASRVDELMAGHVKTHDFSGTILLAKDGTPVVAKGYGFANIEWKIPNALDTKFRIGSLDQGVHFDADHAAARAGQSEHRRLGLRLRLSVSRGLAAGHHPPSADAHFRDPELHQSSGLAGDHDRFQPYAAGSRYSTAGDLLKWDQALYTDRLIPSAARQTMWTPFKDTTPTAG